MNTITHLNPSENLPEDKPLPSVASASLVTSPGERSPEHRHEQRRERTREQILAATRAALVRSGYENITTRRIAEEAGVNIATLHYYFGTKELLLSETIRYTIRVGEVRLRAATDNTPDALTALEQLFRVIWDIVQERAGVLRFDLAVRGLRDAGARRDANLLYGAFRALVTEVIERHLDSGGQIAPGLSVAHLAFYIVAAVDGTVLQHTLNGDDEAAAQSLILVKQHALALMGPALSSQAAYREQTGTQS